MTPSCVLFLLLTQVTTSFEWVIRAQKGGRIGTRDGGFALLRGKHIRHISDQPEYIASDFERSGWTFDRTTFDNFGGFGSGQDNDVHSQQHGQFTSDMSGCSGIKSQRCSEPSDCAGCLGLYSCNTSIQKCQLKGLSRMPSRFQKSLENV